MSSVAASGCMSLQIDRFRDLIASTAAFQNWCGVTTKSAALEYVASDRVTKKNIRNPMIVVAEESFRWKYTAYNSSVVLVCLFRAEIPRSLLEEDASPQIDFRNHRDAIIKEVIETGFGDDYGLPWDIENAAEPLSPIIRSGKTEEVDVLEHWIRFSYGIR